MNKSEYELLPLGELWRLYQGGDLDVYDEVVRRMSAEYPRFREEFRADQRDAIDPAALARAFQAQVDRFLEHDDVESAKQVLNTYFGPAPHPKFQDAMRRVLTRENFRKVVEHLRDLADAGNRSAARQLRRRMPDPDS